MYVYILGFQIACVLISGICLYLAATDEKLPREKYGMPTLLTFAGIFLQEAGYGLYLQEITMAGLQLAEKICLLGKLSASVGFFVLCVSLSDKDSPLVKTAAEILGLTAAAFLFSDSLNRLLYAEQDFMQNQFFYYIEERRTGLGEIFGAFRQCLPLFGVLWLIWEKKEKDLPEKALLSAVLLLCGVQTFAGRLTILRHFDADMPLGAAFALCLIIFVAWRNKKVYTNL